MLSRSEKQRIQVNDDGDSLGKKSVHGIYLADRSNEGGKSQQSMILELRSSLSLIKDRIKRSKYNLTSANALIPPPPVHLSTPPSILIGDRRTASFPSAPGASCCCFPVWYIESGRAGGGGEGRGQGRRLFGYPNGVKLKPSFSHSLHPSSPVLFLSFLG